MYDRKFVYSRSEIGGGYRNQQIEGLRGVAILIVVLFHIFDRFQQIYLDSSIAWMNLWGEFGVGIFLTISIFYMVDFRKENTALKSSTSFIKRMMKKVLRLWPSYFVAITLIFVLTRILYLPDRTCSIRDYFLNFILVNGYLGTVYVDGAHWYITTLLSIAFFIELARKFRLEKNPIVYLVWGIVVECVCLSPFRGLIRVVGTDRVGYVFVIIAIKWFLQEKSKRNAQVILWGMVLCGGLILIGQNLSITAVLELVIIVPVFLGCFYNKFGFMENRLFLMIGAISYPLYLIHQNTAFVIEYQMMNQTGTYSLWYGVVALVSVFCIATLLYVVVEKWLQMKIKKKLGV